jgi:Tfp pilus assembly protein PilO
MSYALRNSLILLVTLLLIAGTAFTYIKFVQQAEINDLATELESLNTDYNNKTIIRDKYPPLLERFNKAKDIVQNYDKKLYTYNNPDDVYDYLSEINDENLELFYDFTYQDSVVNNQYGILQSRIVGTGIYSDFVTFINKIENSLYLNKIENVNVTPATGEATQDYVDFTLTLNSYYQKIIFETASDIQQKFRINPTISVFNPLKPLVLNSVPANVDNLTNIEQSRLIGLTSTRIFIIDQTGETKILKPGDKVYLGYLREIDSENKEAIFNLDKGGIQEIFTLKVER